MIKRLKDDIFNTLWKEVSELYPTQANIQVLMANAGFKWQQVQLQGTGENMVYSLLSLAEKEGRISDIVNTVLSPGEFPGNATLASIQKGLQDDSAYLPAMKDLPLANPDTGKDVKVMLIYDRQDHEIAGDLNKQLYPFEAFAKKFTVFDMHTSPEVSGGVDAKQVIDTKLKEAQIVLLLLTPNFLGTPGNDCAKLAFNAFELGKRVIPVLLKPCMWDRIAMLENIVPLPKNKEYVSNAKHKDNVLLQIAYGVEEVANALKVK
ncbi:MAG: hypothetical protein NTW29_02540 [Bacteroidetes bacterium]|nr:hypothetical protein [Bacteroidota bacterium]